LSRHFGVNLQLVSQWPTMPLSILGIEEMGGGARAPDRGEWENTDRGVRARENGERRSVKLALPWLFADTAE
jgi:hypothetical protein